MSRQPNDSRLGGGVSLRDGPDLLPLPSLSGSRYPVCRLAVPPLLAELSRARAFKQSFTVPPHRYHTGRRIERAKELLANPTLPVTNIAFSVGFSETGSFRAAFRRLTGKPLNGGTGGRLWSWI